MKHYGYDWCSKVPEIKVKASKSRKITNYILYGGNTPLHDKEIAKNKYIPQRITNEASGHWIPEEDLRDFKKYSRIVRRLTEKQPIHLLENIEKRGMANIQGAYHLDHKYSIKQGFIEGVLPYIIADISNLEMLPAIDNIKKGSKIIGSYSEQILLDR